MMTEVYIFGGTFPLRKNKINSLSLKALSRHCYMEIDLVSRKDILNSSFF